MYLNFIVVTCSRAEQRRSKCTVRAWFVAVRGYVPHEQEGVLSCDLYLA